MVYSLKIVAPINKLNVTAQKVEHLCKKNKNCTFLTSKIFRNLIQGKRTKSVMHFHHFYEHLLVTKKLGP